MMPLLTAPLMLRMSESRVAREMDRHARQLGVKVKADHRILDAQVNHGRWIADCPCGAGIALSPDWREASCLGCLSTFKVRWPAKRKLAVIESVLERRPVANRNWLPHEPLGLLAAENEMHGLGRTEVPDGLD